MCLFVARIGCRYAVRIALEHDVIFTGLVSEQELVALYQEAKIFVFPSLYEGFGLPPLEAMACGTPVITSNVSSLPEVVGEAGLTISPENEMALCDALHRVLVDQTLRTELIYKGVYKLLSFHGPRPHAKRRHFIIW